MVDRLVQQIAADTRQLADLAEDIVGDPAHRHVLHTELGVVAVRVEVGVGDRVDVVTGGHGGGSSMFSATNELWPETENTLKRVVNNLSACFKTISAKTRSSDSETESS